MLSSAKQYSEAPPAAYAEKATVHVVLSLGSNIDPEKNTRFALREITRLYGSLEISPTYRTAAVGFDGPPFLNLIVGLQAVEPLDRIVDSLRQIELQAGRARDGNKYSNKELDIDLILFGAYDLRAQGYNIPRDEILQAEYVLRPLADLYGGLQHPVTGQRFAELWRNFSRSNSKCQKK